MAYPAKAVANYFLDLAKRDGTTIDPLKMQKLIYYANGWHWALLDEPLIREYVEAWPYGPVIRSIYDEFKKYGNHPITEQAKEIDENFDICIPEITANDDQTRSFIERIWETHSIYTSIQLSNSTHLENSPWHKARQAGKNIISDVHMKEYFQSLRNN